MFLILLTTQFQSKMQTTHDNNCVSTLQQIYIMMAC